MSDKKEPSRLYPGATAFYAQYMTPLVEKARECGYALAVHGSMATDLDLVAIPWTEDAQPAEEMVEALRIVVDGVIPNDPDADPSIGIFHNPNAKPHGRRAWSIHLGRPFSGPWIDLSVMPRLDNVLRRADDGRSSPAVEPAEEKPAWVRTFILRRLVLIIGLARSLWYVDSNQGRVTRLIGFDIETTPDKNKVLVFGLLGLVLGVGWTRAKE